MAGATFDLQGTLRDNPGTRSDLVRTDTPLGKDSSVMVLTEEGDEEKQALTEVRDDFRASTSTSRSTSSSMSRRC